MMYMYMQMDSSKATVRARRQVGAGKDRVEGLFCPIRDAAGLLGKTLTCFSFKREWLSTTSGVLSFRLAASLWEFIILVRMS